MIALRVFAAYPGAELVLRLFELSYYLHHDGPHSSNPSNELKAKVLYAGRKITY